MTTGRYAIEPTRLSVETDVQALDRVFAGIDTCHAPGAAVGVAIGGIPIYRKGFGLANVELPMPLSPTVRMRVGSSTKHFTALAYMLLCEEGGVSLDDPISRFLPELHRASARATVRSLIAHTSGLRDVFDLNLLVCGAGIPIRHDDYRAEYETIDHVNAPEGSAWSYNNGGYVLLTRAIEVISGQSLEEFLRHRVLDPVGMHDTLLRRRDSDFVPNSATLHTAIPCGSYSREYMGMELAGEGGLVSTTDDMLRWLKHMDAPVVGSAATWAAMTEPVRLVSGKSTGYGLGLMIHEYRGVKTIAHAGTVFGGNSQMIKVPSADLDIAIMANRSDLSAVDLAERVIDALVPGLAEAPRAVKARAGVFIGERSKTVVQFQPAEDGTLVVGINAADSPTLTSRHGMIAPTAPGMQGTAFAIPDDTDGESIVIAAHGERERAMRLIPPISSTEADIDGRYDLATPAVSLHIVQNGRRMYSKGPFGSAEFTLERLAEDVWRAQAVGSHSIGAVLAFESDRSRLRLSTGRTHSLEFKRLQRCLETLENETSVKDEQMHGELQ